MDQVKQIRWRDLPQRRKVLYICAYVVIGLASLWFVVDLIYEQTPDGQAVLHCVNGTPDPPATYWNHGCKVCSDGEGRPRKITVWSPDFKETLEIQYQPGVLKSGAYRPDAPRILNLLESFQHMQKQQ